MNSLMILYRYAYKEKEKRIPETFIKSPSTPLK